MYKKRYRVDRGRYFFSKNAQLQPVPQPASLLNNHTLNKRGQVTVFIILGIILLLALVLIIALKKEVVIFKPEELIPAEKSQIENYITSCIGRLGQEALEQVGLQGGYVEVPARIVNDPNLHLKVSPMHSVPYWAYGQNQAIPSLEQIKQEIDNHVEKNLRSCLFNLEAFQKTYDLVEMSNLVADTEIVKKKVIFNVRWDIEIRDKAGEKITEVIDHSAESDVKLKTAYETAKKIVEAELDDLKLEDLTQDLIALEHPDVPVAGLELSCQRKQWGVGEAKTALQDMLRVNLKQLKVRGTEFVEFPEQFPYYQNHYVWNVGGDNFNEDVSVVFSYDNNYPFTFQVSPSQNGKMFSGMMGGQDDFIDYLCIQTWKFTYDVVYPVLVRVQDDTGYNFNIAFTVHLIHNLPNRGEEIMPRLTLPTDFVTDDDFCKKNRLPMIVLSWELVDNSKEIHYTEPLEDVKVSFTCLRNYCDLGETEFDFAATGYQAGNIFEFPYCVGGILRGKKEGYKEDWTRVVTKNGDIAELNLVPIVNVPLEKIKVVKHELSDGIVGPAAEISGDEIASITLTFEKNDTNSKLLGEPFHQSRFLISDQFDEEMLKSQPAEFLAKAGFTYDLEVQVFANNDFVGGYKRKWFVDSDDLENAQEMVFHIVSISSAGEEEQFELLSQLEEKSKLVSPPEIN